MLKPALRSRAVLAIALALLVACAVLAPRIEARSGEADYLSWPHEQSDFKPDPSVRFGVLPNGMRYALMRNAEPQNTASVRLRISVGSLQESDDQKGLAHFLEHMAFNGSKNFAEGEAIKVLQRKGLAFGPHTNARTGLQETVYILELPSVDDGTMDTGLRFMRDIADGLNLDAGAIDRERGIIMSEERQGDTPERRAFNDRFRLTYAGHQAAERLPIGDMQVIRTARRELIADFYNKFYRPERATLVIVGQIDVDAIEAKIKAGFSDWQRGTAADGRYGEISEAHLRTGQHVEPNLPDDATIAWLSAPDDASDTRQVRRERDIRDVGFAVLNRRLGRLARKADAPFVASAASRGVLRGVATVASLSLNARPGRWSQGLAAAEQELRRTLQYGISQAEIDREIAVYKAQIADAAARADTRYDRALADAIVESLSQRRVFTNPRDEVATYAANVDGLTAVTVTDALRRAFDGEPSVIFVSSGQPVGEGAVRAAYLAAHEAPVVAGAEIQAKEFPYTDFGQAGAIVHREDVADLGVTLLRFGNGVRLNVKPTTFEKDSIAVKVRYAGGYLALPKDRIGLYWALPFGMIEGGLKKLTTEELEEALAGRILSADLGLDEESFEFSGNTNRSDFDLQFQLLAAFATEPAYRGEGLARLQGAAENYIRQYGSSPGRVLSRETSTILRSNDARWRFPTLQHIQSLTMHDIEAVLSPALRAAPIEITIVGDIDVETAVGAVSKTFGALPPRGSSYPRSDDVRFPAHGSQLNFTHEGRADQAVAYAAWPGPDFASKPRLARTVVLMRDMIKVRLTDEFREKQGATYSPFVASWSSGSIAGFGYLAAGSETPPAQVDAFYATIDLIVKDLRNGKFEDDLIERARRPIIEAALKDRRTNAYWANAIEDAQTQNWTLAAVRSFQNDMETIQRDEIVAAARAFLTDRRRIEVRVLPKD